MEIDGKVEKSWRRQQVWILATVAVAVFCFLKAAALSHSETFAATEAEILQSFRSARDPQETIGPVWLRVTAIDLTALGGTPVITLLTVLVCAYFLLRWRWRRAFFVAGAISLGAIFNSLLKALYDRARPDVVPHLTEVASASFPSGHSMMASITYLTLGALLARSTDSRRERVYFYSVSAALTLLIGFTRVFLGVHYPSDVVAGWAGGFAWAVLCSVMALRLEDMGRLHPARGHAGD